MIFDDRLAQALARMKRRVRPAVLVAMIDLDDFKQINDTYGHAKGDEALRHVAERLKDCLRDEDSIGRLGGDEFAVVADISVSSADAMLERLRRTSAGFDPSFTLSVGAVIAQDGDDVTSVLERADAAMYAVKRECKRTRATRAKVARKHRGH